MDAKQWTYALILLLGACLQPAAAGAQTGVIQGTVGLVVESRRFIPGSHVRLYLVSEPIAIAPDPKLARLDKFQTVAYLNERHVDFFVQVRQRMARPGYIVADTLSADDGGFEFADIPAGQYHVLVTFPTIIHGHKVAWQVPVTVSAGDRVNLDLRNFNMALPTASRYSAGIP